MAAAANAEERPVGSWLRIAAKEKLARATSIPVVGDNTGHGWVRLRPDGANARCGGPAICTECAKEEAALNGRSEVQPRFKGKTK
jgi:hypothetical protein